MFGECECLGAQCAGPSPPVEFAEQIKRAVFESFFHLGKERGVARMSSKSIYTPV